MIRRVGPRNQGGQRPTFLRSIQRVTSSATNAIHLVSSREEPYFDISGFELVVNRCRHILLHVGAVVSEIVVNLSGIIPLTPHAVAWLLE
jgi:hypothetical protein